MKNERKLKANYWLVKRKALQRVGWGLVVLVGVCLSIYIYKVSINPGASLDYQVKSSENGIEYKLVKETIVRSMDAMGIFIYLAGRYKWIIFGLGALGGVALWLFMRWIETYFHQIGVGMDHLMEETPADIYLSPELYSLEQKLNTVKRAFARQKYDLETAEQRKNDLVMYLAHDLKTPLTSIIGYLSLLEETPNLPREQRTKYMDIALEKAFRLEQLIDEFFEITRFSLQTISLTLERVDLALMLQQLADEFSPLVTPDDKQIIVTGPQSLFVEADGDKLARVFANVLRNAISYSYAHTAILIEAQILADTVQITFANEGDPIPAAKISTIFEQFYRLDTARSGHTGGAGLGLAIAKEIVTAHKGVITAASTEEKTVFTIILPLSPS